MFERPHAHFLSDQGVAELAAAVHLPVVARTLDGNLRDGVPNARLGNRDIALLFAAVDDASALSAIEAGADEVLIVPEEGGAVDFVQAAQRALVRASVRLHTERLFGSAAHAEKLRALGALVAGVAHEINNPCAALLLSIEVVRRRLTPLFELAREASSPEAYKRGLEATLRRVDMQRSLPDMSPILDDMARATDSISAIVRDLRVFTRADELEQPQRVDLHEVLDQVLRLAGSRITAVGHLERDYAAELPPVFVPRSRLAQVLTNILVNAAQAITQIERPVHRVRVSTRADEEGVVVAISDTGPGILPEHLDRIFDPFFTTKKPGEGTGLGLALSTDLVRRMGGQIIAESNPGEGATFLVYLPSAPDDVLEEESRDARWVQAASPRRRVILAVDNDERVLRAYARTLRDSYDVLLATDGQEAIDLLRSGSQADAVLTDLQMPEVDGRQLMAWLEEHRPELSGHVVVVTATPLTEAEDGVLRGRCAALLAKPATHEGLLSAIERALPVPADLLVE